MSALGDAASVTISAAASGDASRLQRMQNLDAPIVATVEPHAATLEQRGEKPCARLIELDRLDNALEFRLAKGPPLK